MFERSHIEEGGAAALKGEELHRRFVAAAEAGGGWVSHTARKPGPSCKPEPGPDLHLTCTLTKAHEHLSTSTCAEPGELHVAHLTRGDTLPTYHPHVTYLSPPPGELHVAQLTRGHAACEG